MKRILKGVARFEDEIFPGYRERFRQLARGQQPEALMITCSDSRVVPDLIVQAGPGELFVCRNAGNIAPSYGEHSGGVSATIEYAVLVLGVKDIIVCGHSDCGAMRALLDRSTVSGMPSVNSWLRHAEPAEAVVRHNLPRVSPEAVLNAVIEENVLTQLDNLKTHPCVASRLKSGALSLHGWVFDIETGRFRAFDADRRQFLPLRELAAAAADNQTEITHA